MHATYLTKTFFSHVLSTKRSRQTTKSPVEAFPESNESSEDTQWNTQESKPKAKTTVEDSRIPLNKAKKTVEDTVEQIVIDNTDFRNFYTSGLRVVLTPGVLRVVFASFVSPSSFPSHWIPPGAMLASVLFRRRKKQTQERNGHITSTRC